MKILIVGKPPVEVPKNIKLSPTMQVRVGGDKAILMNRKERRRQGLYGDRVTITRVRR